MSIAKLAKYDFLSKFGGEIDFQQTDNEIVTFVRNRDKTNVLKCSN